MGLVENQAGPQKSTILQAKFLDGVLVCDYEDLVENLEVPFLGVYFLDFFDTFVMDVHDWDFAVFLTQQKQIVLKVDAQDLALLRKIEFSLHLNNLKLYVAQVDNGVIGRNQSRRAKSAQSYNGILVDLLRDFLFISVGRTLNANLTVLAAPNQVVILVENGRHRIIIGQVQFLNLEILVDEAYCRLE